MTSLLTGKLRAGGFQDPKAVRALVLLGDEGKSQGRGCSRVGQRAVRDMPSFGIKTHRFFQRVMLRNGSFKPPNLWSI